MVVRNVLPLAAGLLLLAALWLMPDVARSPTVADPGQERWRATVTEAGERTDPAGQPLVRVRLAEGERAGHEVDAVVQQPGVALPGAERQRYEVGEEVVVSAFTGPAGGFVTVDEPWRVPLLTWLAAGFVVAVLLVGGLRGARSLVALAFTLLVIGKLLIPLLLAGWQPLPLAIGTAAGVTVVTLLLTEGARRTTLAAILGTAAALAVTAVLAHLATEAARFSSLQGSEEVAFLVVLLGEQVDLGGMLLAGTILGALGVLDDVTVTQAAAVAELRAGTPHMPRSAVFARAMAIGRSHIGATVNTLVLAYVGASLPLLLLFAVGESSPLVAINGELLAVEVVRALAGSIGIVAAVPLTTVVAALLVAPATQAARSEPDLSPS
ncbi:MAG TPA: YibE/F family protein [Candidatus Limnocylindria bacterium]|nr:YibE/F family protein [Candidatus Limnocylindria bacterium]